MASVKKKTFTKNEQICRTCLSKNGKLHRIFDKYNGTITIDHIVTSITGLKIAKNDGLPPNICSKCYQKASNAYDFKKKSEEAYIQLQGAIEKVTHEKEIELDLTDVKIEDTLSNDNFDYSDSDYHVAEPELDAVKSENDQMSTNQSKSLECKQCFVVFKTHNEFEDHQKKNCVKIECDDSSGTYCPLCGTRHTGADDLTKHMWKYHPEVMGPRKRGRPRKTLSNTIISKLSENGVYVTPVRSNGCSVCKEVFKTKKELGAHLLNHKDVKIFCCEMCKKMFLERSTIDQHNCSVDKDMSAVDTGENMEIRFFSEIRLGDLINMNNDTEHIAQLLQCTGCSSVFLYEKDLLDHHDSEHPELSQRCNLCSKVFASVRSAARHRSTCKEVEKKHKCSTCGLKFSYEISLNKHILRYHKGQSVSVRFINPNNKNEEIQFQCDNCNKSFSKRELLVKHTKLHMPNEKCFECDVCKKRFHRRDNLRSHKKVHEPKCDKPAGSTALCLYCGRSFSNSSNLIVHMRRHTGEKPYKCDFCGKGFPRSSDLQCHRRSHTGEKPCVCRVCGKGFSRSNKLSRHMRVHTGQRPYKCTYCDKAFSQSNDLTLHIRRHTGDRPYICEVCGDRFIQGTALQNHKRAHGHFQPTATEIPVVVQSFSYAAQTHANQ